MIFNYILDYIHSRFNQLLNSWNQDTLQPNKQALYSNVIHENWAPLQNCFGFVDRAVLRIFRPKISQNIVWNGRKPVYGIRFQSLAVRKRFIGNLSGPNVGKRHDSAMLHEPWPLTNLQRSVFTKQSVPLHLLRSTIPLSIHSQAPFSRQNVTPNPVNYNKAMSQTRVSCLTK